MNAQTNQFNYLSVLLEYGAVGEDPQFLFDDIKHGVGHRDDPIKVNEGRGGRPYWHQHTVRRTT